MKQRNDSIAPASKKSETSSVRPRAVTLVEAIAGILAVLTPLRALLAPFAPSAALVALYRGQISDAQAAKVGERASADVVLADAASDLPLAADAVIAGKVPGFGPSELCFTVDLAIELASSAQGNRTDRGAMRAASSRKRESHAAMSGRRAELYAVLSSVTPSEGEARDAFESRIRVTGKSRHAIVASLDAMGTAAREMLQRAENDASLATYYRDKGFSAERVNALVEPAARAMRARTEHASARAKTLASSTALDRVEGRLRDELMRLRVAVEAQRASGVALPEVELRGIRRVGYVARPAAPPAPPAP